MSSNPEPKIPNPTNAPQSPNATRVLEILIADKERNSGFLDPQRVDSLMVKRGLDASERVWVYERLGLETTNTNTGLKKPPIEKKQATETTSSSGDSVKSLLNSTKTVPLLFHEEEKILGRLIQNGKVLRKALENGNIQNTKDVLDAIKRAEDAEGQMVLANIRLVVSVASKYQHSSLDMADLVQEGIFGLMRAVRKFDPELDTKFSTYAVWWIRQSILRAMGDKGRTIRFPIHVGDAISKFRKTQHRLTLINGGKKPTILELAKELGLSEKQTTAIYAYSEMGFDSIDEPLELMDGKAPTILIDPLPTPDVVAEQNELESMIDENLEDLKPREADILRRRFGLSGTIGESETLERIGLDLGLTRERIRQIEVKALKKLSHPRRKRKLKDFDQK